MATSKIKHYINIAENGETMKLEEPATYMSVIKKNAGKRMFFILSLIKKDRSSKENRYFHGVICEYFAEAMGCLPEESKEALKWEFLRKELDCGVMTVTPTSSLSTVEFEDFCAKCRTLFTNLFGAGVRGGIPKPNEVDF